MKECFLLKKSRHDFGCLGVPPSSREDILSTHKVLSLLGVRLLQAPLRCGFPAPINNNRYH